MPVVWDPKYRGVMNLWGLAGEGGWASPPPPGYVRPEDSAMAKIFWPAAKSMTSGVIDTIADRLSGARALRGVLTGKPRELLSVVPESDYFGLTDPTQNKSFGFWGDMLVRPDVAKLASHGVKAAYDAARSALTGSEGAVAGLAPTVAQAIDPALVKKPWFHGSSTPGITLKTLDPLKTQPRSDYGRGIYLTDAAERAKFYAGSGRGVGTTPTVYRAKIGPQEVLDLNRRVDPQVADLAANVIGNDPTGLNLLDRMVGRKEDVSEILSLMNSRLMSRMGDDPGSRALTQALRKAGYDSLLGMEQGAGGSPSRTLVNLDPLDKISNVGRPGGILSWRADRRILPVTSNIQTSYSEPISGDIDLSALFEDIGNTRFAKARRIPDYYRDLAGEVKGKSLSLLRNLASTSPKQLENAPAEVENLISSGPTKSNMYQFLRPTRMYKELPSGEMRGVGGPSDLDPAIESKLKSMAGWNSMRGEALGFYEPGSDTTWAGLSYKKPGYAAVYQMPEERAYEGTPFWNTVRHERVHSAIDQAVKNPDLIGDLPLPLQVPARLNASKNPFLRGTGYWAEEATARGLGERGFYPQTSAASDFLFNDTSPLRAWYKEEVKKISPTAAQVFSALPVAADISKAAPGVLLLNAIRNGGEATNTEGF